MSKLARLKEISAYGDPIFPLSGAVALLGKLGGAVGKAAGAVGVRGAAAAAGRAATKAAPYAAAYAMGRARGRAVPGPVGPARRRRSRGISGLELRGFRRVAGLLRSVGMVPKATRRGLRRKCC